MRAQDLLEQLNVKFPLDLRLEAIRISLEIRCNLRVTLLVILVGSKAASPRFKIAFKWLETGYGVWQRYLREVLLSGVQCT